jgi:hypothetical protein
MVTVRIGVKTRRPFTLPVDLPAEWSVKALPDRTMVILEYKPLGNYLGAVTVNEVDRTYALGADARDPIMKAYSGRNWRARLYRDAMDALERLLG